MSPRVQLSTHLKLLASNWLNRLNRRVMGARTKALLVESRNGLLLIDAEDRTIGRRLAKDGEYSWAEIERLCSHLQPLDEILIVGAHVGSIAIPIARYCRQVIAVEANPHTYQFLELNVHINRASNIRTVNIAAGDKEEEIEFVMNRVNSGGSKRMPVARDYVYFSDSPETARVKAMALDEVLADAQPAVIFMDIEGSEYFAVKGMQRLLSGARVFFMEFLPHHLRNVSGVTVPELLSFIQPHFSTLLIPSKQLTAKRDDFESVLQQMYEADEGDDGLVFQK
jgi:FkbM family methyltransferase